MGRRIQGSRCPLDFSILIPTKGRSHLLQPLVDHLQTMIPSEITYEILIRDASPPNGLVLHGASHTYADEFVPKAMNKMAEEAQGEFLFMLGDDMKVYPRTFPTCLTIMRQLPGAVGIPFHADPGIPCHAFLAYPELFVASRQLYHWLGGLDEQFSYGYADFDFGMKAFYTKRPLVSLLGVCVQHDMTNDATKRHNVDTHLRVDEVKFFKKWPARPIGAELNGSIVDFQRPKMCPFPHEN